MELTSKQGRFYVFNNTKDIDTFFREGYRDDLFTCDRNLYQKFIEMGKLDYVKYIEKWYDNMICLNNRDLNEDDALLIAVSHGHLDIVKHLLEIRKWNIETTDKTGCNVYHAAAMFGHVHIMKYLEQEHSIDIYSKTPFNGTNAAIFATYNDHVKVLKHLHENHQYDFSITNNKRRTAYYYANGYSVKEFLEYIKNNILSKLKTKFATFSNEISLKENRLKEINIKINELFNETTEINKSIIDIKKNRKMYKDKILSLLKVE